MNLMVRLKCIVKQNYFTEGELVKASHLHIHHYIESCIQRNDQYTFSVILNSIAPQRNEQQSQCNITTVNIDKPNLTATLHWVLFLLCCKVLVDQLQM